MINETKHHALFGTEQPVALVTGSGAKHRLGQSIARDLARNGYRLVIHANRSATEAEQFVEELRSQGTDAIWQVADLSKQTEVEKIFEECQRAFGRLDALANCASIWERRELSEISDNDVRRHFEVNTLGTFLCCQIGGQIMVDQPSGGVIVNFGDWATRRPYEAYAAYFASKGAIPTITRDFAIELARRNPRIRVNAVLPGPVTLPDDLPSAARQAAIDSSLLKREGKPEHVVDATLFLLEHEYLTGVCLPVDGGRSIYAPTDHWR
ncbi:MAG: SDR family oxidoreductase [Pirellulaceae bacterium]|nr:SDR family oxidoreductase [Pirellulaceae bacterium]